MTLESLKRLDRETANGILAAAALASLPNPGVGDGLTVLQTYSDQADEVLREIRSSLKLDPGDTSVDAHRKINAFIAKQLEGSIFQGVDTAQVLARVGQAGELAPSNYTVVQPKAFQQTFYQLGVTAGQVDEAIRAPTEYQHLLTEGAPDAERKRISIFLKQILSREPSKNHWLVVQTHRVGIEQVAQAAWRVYLDEVDLTQAFEPIHVLKAFVETYGSPIRVGDEEALFVDSLTFPIDAKIEVDWRSVGEKNCFVSFSHIANRETNLVNVGVAYCILLDAYKAALRKHGVKLVEKPALPGVLHARTETLAKV